MLSGIVVGIVLYANSGCVGFEYLRDLNIQAIDVEREFPGQFNSSEGILQKFTDVQGDIKRSQDTGELSGYTTVALLRRWRRRLAA